MISAINTFTVQQVLLKGTKTLRTMDVTSTREERTEGARGAVRFNGKTVAVQYSQVGDFWKAI